jgi:hypothetical protein
MSKTQEKHRKLIDIPLDTLEKLKKKAKKENRELKNYIEHHLILLGNVKEQG